MLANRKYKNFLPLRDNPDPTERRQNLTKEALRNGTFFPNPIEYEDIDKTMEEWVNKTLELSFEGNKLPTIALFTNQRFEEYMQEWEHSDNKKNLLMNFKTISRENNPKHGTINGNSFNIPGDRFYTIHREEIVDRNGQISYLDYKMKQPFAVDLTYSISIVTGKYELINRFNTLCQDIFKSGYAYISVNGNYMSIKMEDPKDDSEYSIDDRRYFSQTIQVTVRAYIIREDDFKIEETPRMTFHITEGSTKNVSVEIEEDDEAVVCPKEEDNLYYKPLSLITKFEKCEENEITMRIPYKMGVMNIQTKNIARLSLKIDGEEILNLFFKKDSDEYKIFDSNNNVTEIFFFEEAVKTTLKIRRINPLKEADVIFDGYDKDTIVDDDDIQEEEELIIN